MLLIGSGRSAGALPGRRRRGLPAAPPPAPSPIQGRGRAGAAGGEKESDRARGVRPDLGAQGSQILAEQRPQQHRQHHQIEEPARGLPESIRARTRAARQSRRTPQTRQKTRATASAGVRAPCG